MIGFEDTIWQHLVEHHDADQVPVPVSPHRSRTRSGLVGVAAAGIAAAATTAILISSPSTQAAYALSSHGNGSYTLKLNDLTTGIPAVNAKLKQLGIAIRVVPITKTCRVSNRTSGNTPASSVQRLGAHTTAKRPTDVADNTITFHVTSLRTGLKAVIGAERRRDGDVWLVQATTSQSVPSCLSTSAHQLSRQSLTRGGQ